MANGYWYGQALLQALGSGTEGNSPNVDWLTHDIKVMLCTSSYAPNQDTHVFKSDVTNEVTGTNYTAGGQSLASKTASYASKTVKLDAADTTWGTSTITAYYAVIYRDTGTGSTSPLLGYVNFGQDIHSEGGNFTLQWDSAGVLKITVS